MPGIIVYSIWYLRVVKLQPRLKSIVRLFDCSIVRLFDWAVRSHYGRLQHRQTQSTDTFDTLQLRQNFNKLLELSFA